MRPFWPRAWLLTWTTYGTWLHGDARGSYDASAPQRPFVKPNIRLVAMRRGQLLHEPVLLNARARRVVRASVEEHVDYRNWTLLALNVRTNHVHAVLQHAPAGATRMLQALKQRATRMLREAGLARADQTVWTSKGSLTWLLNDEEVALAVDYVRYGQGEDLPEE